MVLYALVFPVLYPFLDLTAAALNAIPALAFGWLLGVRGSLLYALFAVPTNIFLFSLVGKHQQRCGHQYRGCQRFHFGKCRDRLGEGPQPSST
jgi:hypothetical protein